MIPTNINQAITQLKELSSQCRAVLELRGTYR